MSQEFDFAERLAFSRGACADTHPNTIRRLIPGCVSVTEPSVELNKRGIDFVAELRRGATLNVDVKTRDKGCGRYWKSSPSCGREPELALEYWSERPTADKPGKAGWTLDESKFTDYTLHVFDPSDTTEVFLLPFQLLRAAFGRHCQTWRRRFGSHIQKNKGWESECVFVPASLVLAAIQDEMRRRDEPPPEPQPVVVEPVAPADDFDPWFDIE